MKISQNDNPTRYNYTAIFLVLWKRIVILLLALEIKNWNISKM